MFKKFISLFIKNPDDYSSPETRAEYGKFSSVLSIILNAILFGIKLLAGIITGATSVIADALNNLTDASSNVISFLGFKLSSKPADADHPYGHGRYEYISAAVVAVLIMLIGFELLGSGIKGIFNPTTLTFSVASIIILAVSIIIKVLMYIINNNIGKKINSDALIATATDSRNDALTTACVLVSVIIANAFNFSLDGYMTVGVAVFILISGFSLVKNTIATLLGKPADKDQVEYIKNKITSYEGVLGIHDLIIHDYGPGRQYASVHIEMSASENVLKSHEIIDGIEKDFLTDDNITLVIHFDPICVDNEFIKELRVFLQREVLTINENLTVHDVRLVEGIEHDIVIFDCVMPYNVNLTEQELKLLITEKIKNAYSKLDCVITIDRSYVSEH